MTTETAIREALSAGPTEGPWTLCRSTLDGELLGWHIAGKQHGSRDAICTADERGHERGPAEEAANAAFIAACNPTAIRALLADLETLRQRAEKAEEDAWRLDALEANPRWQLDCEVLKFGVPGKWRVWSIKGNRHKSTDIRVHGEGDTPREALDAARSATGPQGGTP